MKYNIVSLNPSNFLNLNNQLKNLLDKKGFYSPEDFEYLFVLGGDGTLIHYVKEYAFKNKKIIGVKGGTVSFLICPETKDIFLDNNNFIEIELLKITIEDQEYYAFNDFFIAGDSFLKAEIFVNNMFFKKFRGSGLLFSTKLGSTAQNKSFLGPILFPSTNTWLLNSIGTQTTGKLLSLNSPLVFSREEKVEIKISDAKHLLYIDGKRIKPLNYDSLKLKIELIKTNSSLLFPMNTKDYLKKLSSSFLNN